MNRQEFTELIKNISELPNDLTIRRAFIEREFIERYNYSIEDGYNITSAYFEEFENEQNDTLQGILISNKLQSDFEILFNYKGYKPKHNLLRMNETDFKQSKELFLPLYDLGVTEINVHEIFERNFNRWRVSNSHEVTSDGTQLNQSDKLMLFVPIKETQTGTVEVSDTTKNGYQLTEQMFIDEQLRKYEPMYTRTKGSEKNREQNIKLKIWIDYLKKRNKQRDAKPRFILSDKQIESLYQFLTNKSTPYINTSKENFKAICNGQKEFEPITWIHKNKNGDVNKTSLNGLCRVLLEIDKNPPKKILNELFEIKGMISITISTPKIKDIDGLERHIRKFKNAIKPSEK